MKVLADIPFHKVPGFSKLFLDYVAAHPAAEKLYAFRPDQKGYAEAIRAVQTQNYDREQLVKVLQEQYTTYGLTLAEDLMSKLLMPDSVTVVTGHQLCLAGGPAYFIYKIASVIRLAEKLESMYGVKAVPVYWMASEDHDIDEIRSVNLFGKTISWETEQTGATGRLSTDDLNSLVTGLAEVLGNSPAAAKITDILKNVYAEGQTLAQATARFVHAVFGDKVLIIDPDHASFKKAMYGIFRKELFHPYAFKLVTETATYLEQSGYDVQVNPREINLFWLEGNSRERIERSGDNFRLVGSERIISADEMEKVLETSIERLSPNVVLRPLYQQVLLPNVAYVGGPGEISYWLEYLELFKYYKVIFPVLQPRFFAVMLGKKDEEWLKKNNMSVEELLEDSEQLLKRKLAERAGEELSLENEKEVLSLLRQTIADKAALADSTLRAFADAEMKKAEEALKVVEVRMLRALKQREEIFAGQLKKMREKILPGNILQERFENFSALTILYGITAEHLMSNELFPVTGLKFITAD